MQYIYSKRAVKRIENQIKEFRLDKMCPCISYDDMPHSNSIKDLSDYMVKLDEMLSDLIKAKYDRITVYTEVRKQIELMNDEKLQEILELKYINGMKFEEICNEIGCSLRHVHRLHGKALPKFKLPE
ncbi:DUF1492 domain-containing protein [Lachnospiraceae bacterium LCP25S3_G4]